MTDSDWATRHSTSGWLFMFSSAAISLGSRRQVSIALSSCEAEIMALSEASKEAIYLKRFAAEMDIHDESPIELHGDNKGAIDFAYNPEHHSRTKHIDRRHFYVRERVENGEIVVPYVLRVSYSLVLKLSKSGSGLVWSPFPLSLDHIWKSVFPKTIQKKKREKKKKNKKKRKKKRKKRKKKKKEKEEEKQEEKEEHPKKVPTREGFEPQTF